MAGGKFAEKVCCMICVSEGLLTEAARVDEGLEDDHYRCTNGHEFGIDWSRGSPAQPQWPPSEEMQAFAEQSRKQ